MLVIPKRVQPIIRRINANKSMWQVVGFQSSVSVALISFLCFTEHKRCSDDLRTEDGEEIYERLEDSFRKTPQAPPQLSEFHLSHGDVQPGPTHCHL